MGRALKSLAIPQRESNKMIAEERWDAMQDKAERREVSRPASSLAQWQTTQEKVRCTS